MKSAKSRHRALLFSHEFRNSSGPEFQLVNLPAGASHGVRPLSMARIFQKPTSTLDILVRSVRVIVPAFG